MKLTAETPNKN